MLKKLQKMCFSPRGSVWSVEGCILLRISLGLAVRHCWSDLEKFPKSASGDTLENVSLFQNKSFFINVPLFHNDRPFSKMLSLFQKVPLSGPWALLGPWALVRVGGRP